MQEPTVRTLIAFAFSILVAAMTALPALAGVGFQQLSVPDPQGPPIEVGVWYPTADGAEGPVEGQGLGLVIMSHGHGGGYAGHVDTAIALAKAGFVAAALTHTGDNWRDLSRATAIWERPRQLKLLADYMLADWPGHGAIDPRRMGAFGFSLGGFTVLTAAGGEPDLAAIVGHCRAHPDFEDCQLIAAQPQAFADAKPWVHDGRIRAVVSAAPALGFTFGKAGLAEVRQPVQLWRASDDRVLPDPHYAEAVRVALPSPPETHVAANAGHYDFLTPCSAQLAQAIPMICTSAPGFDRTAFHAAFNAEVVAFFQRTLR
jgi:predicted dienelactone hydrolase